MRVVFNSKFAQLTEKLNEQFLYNAMYVNSMIEEEKKEEKDRNSYIVKLRYKVLDKKKVIELYPFFKRRNLDYLYQKLKIVKESNKFFIYNKNNSTIFMKNRDTAENEKNQLYIMDIIGIYKDFKFSLMDYLIISIVFNYNRYKKNISKQKLIEIINLHFKQPLSSIYISLKKLKKNFILDSYIDGTNLSFNDWNQYIAVNGVSIKEENEKKEAAKERRVADERSKQRHREIMYESKEGTHDRLTEEERYILNRDLR